MAKNYVGGKVSFTSEKVMYEYACDAVKFAVLGLKIPEKKKKDVISLVDKACKRRMKKLGFN